MIVFRPARREDLAAIVALLAEDPLGVARETGTMADYEASFARIAASDAVDLIVGVDASGQVVATYQFVLLPGLSRAAPLRAMVEGVRVAAPLRSQGVGAALMADAEARARGGGATALHLTTHRTRTRAQAFYDRLGFTPSHIGYRRSLT